MQRICTKLQFSLIAGTGFVQRVLLLGDKVITAVGQKTRRRQKCNIIKHLGLESSLGYF